MSPAQQFPISSAENDGIASSTSVIKNLNCGQPKSYSSGQHSGQPKSNLSVTKKEKSKSGSNRKGKPRSNVDEMQGLTVNTRVVYFDKDSTIHGVVKFLGSIKEFDDSVWAVVETVSYLTTLIYIIPKTERRRVRNESACI